MYVCEPDLCQSGTDVDTAGSAGQSWIKCQLQGTKTRENNGSLRELLNRFPAVVCAGSYSSSSRDECWLRLWEHSYPRWITFLLFLSAATKRCFSPLLLHSFLLFFFSLLSKNRENVQGLGLSALVLKRKSLCDKTGCNGGQSYDRLFHALILWSAETQRARVAKRRRFFDTMRLKGKRSSQNLQTYSFIPIYF